MVVTLLCLLLAIFCGQFIEGSVVSANNRESVRIYNILRGDHDSNLICSPPSISVVLSLTLAGAKGNTAKEISKGLEYSNLTQAQVNKGYHDLIPKLTGSKDYDLVLANSIWVLKKVVVLQAYKNLVHNDYHAEIGVLNQSNPANQINSWVRDKTKGLIPSVFKSLNSNVLMVLVNAIYFKGTWMTQFKPSDTKDKVFFTKDGKPAKKLVPQMHVTSQFRYLDSSTLGAQVVELPYKGQDVAMIIVLPHSKSGLEAMEKKLKFSDLAAAISHLSLVNVNLTIPKFKIESNFELVEPIKKLGIRQALQENANFSGITRSAKLRISDACQRAIIEVSESGTKAAAVTSVFAGGNKRAPPRPPRIVEFTANHPFMYILLHVKSDSILFLGRFVKP